MRNTVLYNMLRKISKITAFRGAELKFCRSMMHIVIVLMAMWAQSALAQSDAICDPFDGDIDDDDDRLIEICYLEDLDAMRYQANGTGYTTSTGAMKITAGCPDEGCNGYELSRDLDFLEDASYRDAAANKAAYTVDDFDDNTDQGWEPIQIQGFINQDVILNGNRHTLLNLGINRPNSIALGIFNHRGIRLLRIRDIGLINARIKGFAQISALAHCERICVITNSYAVGGSIIAMDDHVGGLVGIFTGEMRNSYANISVIGGNYVGGLAGNIDNVLVENSYAAGNVAGISRVGGLAGSAPQSRLLDVQLMNSYAAAVVAGDSQVGGLIDSTAGQGLTASNNYWDIERSGQSSSIGEGVGQITGLTTVEMTSPTAPGTTVTEAYYGWSEDDWDFGSRYDYPALKYNDGSGDLLGHQRPETKLSRLLLGMGERTLPLDVEQNVHQQSVDFDIEQISLIADNDSEAILHISGTTATSGEMRSFDLAVARTTTITLTLSLPYYAWPRIYAIEVYRKANVELSELNVSAGQLMPPFNPQTTFYTLSVSATTETLIVTPVAADSMARVEVDGEAPGRQIMLREGTTTISILVGSSQDTTTQSYTLAVRRPSRDARLQALNVEDGVLQPEFAAERTTYTAAVFGAERVRLVPRAHRGATIEVNGVRVANGQLSAAIEVVRGMPTRITIMVTAEDGVTTQRYVVWAVRRVGTEARLATLSLPDIALDPAFDADSEQRLYTTTVRGISEVVLTATAALGGTLKVIGSKERSNDEYAIDLLRDGARPTTTHIVITVSSEDGTTQTNYRVAIQRRPSREAQLIALNLADDTQAVPLSPSFSSTHTMYRAMVVGALATTLTATVSRYATLSVNDKPAASGQATTINLNPSTTTNITLIVSAEDGITTMSYTVTVTHQPSREAQLTALSLATSRDAQSVPLSPPFSATHTTYTATVAGTSAITLTATANRYATLAVSVNGAPPTSGQASLPISPGETTLISIIVTAQDATTRTEYTITVTRTATALRIRSKLFLEAPLP